MSALSTIIVLIIVIFRIIIFVIVIIYLIVSSIMMKVMMIYVQWRLMKQIIEGRFERTGANPFFHCHSRTQAMFYFSFLCCMIFLQDRGDCFYSMIYIFSICHTIKFCRNSFYKHCLKLIVLEVLCWCKFASTSGEFSLSHCRTCDFRTILRQSSLGLWI